MFTVYAGGLVLMDQNSIRFMCGFFIALTHIVCSVIAFNWNHPFLEDIKWFLIMCGVLGSIIGFYVMVNSFLDMIKQPD